MRNSSLVKLTCIDNSTGLKPSTEAVDLHIVQVVGERGSFDEAAAEARRGGRSSANAGMSNVMWGANPHHRKPKGSAARALRGGLGGP